MQSNQEPFAPEYKVESRCRVCSAPDQDVPNGSGVRNLIDELLMVPRSYSAISRLIDPLMDLWPEDVRISKESVMRHAKRHLGWEDAAVRQIAERRARNSGKVGEVVGRMLTAATVYEVIQQRGFDQVLSGDLNPTVKDMLNATAALRELEQETEDDLSPAYLLSQLDRAIQVIRDFIPQDVWPQVLQRLEAGESVAPLPPIPDPVLDEIGADDWDGLTVEGLWEVPGSATSEG
jgi:hypothetical protein